MNIQPLDKAKLAKSAQGYLDLLASDADWFARTADDVHALRAGGVGPFIKLPEADFQEFVASLTFSQGGLGHASYKPLMGSLSLTEISAVFAHFGIDPIHLLDYQDMKCTGSHSCSTQYFSVCTSSC